METFYIYLNAFTAFNLFLFSSFLFFRKKNSLLNKLLACTILIPTFIYISNILTLIGLIHNVPWVYFLVQLIILVYGPVIYLYIVLLTGGQIKLITPLNILTFLTMSSMAGLIAYFYSLPVKEQISFINGLSNGNYPLQMSMFNAAYVILLFGYFICAFGKIIKHLKTIKEFYSDIEMVKARYLKHLILLLLTLSILLALGYIFLLDSFVDIVISPIIVNIIFVFIVYYAFRDSAILSATEYRQLIADIAPLELYKQEKNQQSREVNNSKDDNETLKTSFYTEELDTYYNRLILTFERDKLYLDPSITLSKLSNAIQSPSHILSVVIKIKFKSNFFDLINSYRIKEAQKMLKELNKRNITIEGLAFEVGFNSRSAFYRAFKKYSNLTPSEYLGKINRETSIG